MTAARTNHNLLDFIDAVTAAPEDAGAKFIDWTMAQGAVVTHIFTGRGLDDQQMSTLPDWEVEQSCDIVKGNTVHVAAAVARGEPRTIWGVEFIGRIPGLTRIDVEMAEVRASHFKQRSAVTFAMPGPDGRYSGGGIGLGFDEPAEAFDRRMARTGGSLTLAAHLTYSCILKHSGSRSPSPLSPRQAEILTLLAQGYRQGEIADRLCLSDSAVTLYLTNMRRKLGVRTKEQALARAVRHGWIAI